MSKPFLTFKDYLRIVYEDAATDADKLRADIAMLDSAMAQKNKPFLDKKILLTKQLGIKERQAQAEAKRNPQDSEMIDSQTPTPGSSGGGTPGTSDQR